MKNTISNLFVKWKRGHLVGPKVYLIRIYYVDKAGNSQTCLKLGRTGGPLHERIIGILGAMRRATGFLISQYEVISLLYNSNSTGIEYALHNNYPHLYFFNGPDFKIRFDGSDEIFQYTPENCNLIRNPTLFFTKGEYVVPYKFRKNNKPNFIPFSNVV